MATNESDEPNTLYYGDNLDILKRYVDDESIDLVYLDPPFNSARNYNVLFAEQDGTRAAAQIQVFEDTWHWDASAAAAYEEMVEAGGRVSEAMRAFRVFLGDSDMLAYLSMMGPRLIELRRVLKDSGSLYLHCDPTASHYLKMLLDGVFGPENFQNEIIWSYRRWPSPSKHFQSMHDTLLFYSKTDSSDRTFNVEFEEASESYQKRFGGKTQMLDPETKTRKITLEADSKGLPRRDVWEMSILAGSSNERLGYPTQKPQALLERIVATSSKEGDVVLDPFCGCGTTIAAAQHLKRRWVGVDITHLAINLIRTRLRDSYGDSAKFAVIGEPTTLDDAEELAKTDQYQFQWWALGLVGARPAEQKKGADRGIDGQLIFHEDAKKGRATKQVIFSVKAGHVTTSHVRDLAGVLTTEDAEIGVLISFEEPTRKMREAAASMGFYESPWGKHPKIQLLTVGELLEGKTVDMPRTAGTNRTFKKAPKAKGRKEAHPELFGGDD